MDLRQPAFEQLQRWWVRLLQRLQLHLPGVRSEPLHAVRLLLAGGIPLPACTNLQTGGVSTSGRSHAGRFA